MNPLRDARPWLAVLVLAVPGCEGNTPATPTTAGPPATIPPVVVPVPVNRPPVVNISDYQPRTTAVAGGTHVGFGASASDPDGDALTYNWDFGDGSTDTGTALFHVFYQTGEFEVKVTVSDGRGGTASDSVRVRARRVEGEWLLENANRVHMTVKLSQGGGSSSFWGVASDGSLIEGRLLDPYGISLRYSARTDLCVPTGTYSGNIYSGVDTIVFAGDGCQGFTLRR